MTSSLVIKTETHTSLGEYGRDKKLYLKQAPWKHPNGKIQNTKIKEEEYCTLLENFWCISLHVAD